MAKARVKPIHLIKQFGPQSRAVCDTCIRLMPIEATIKSDCFDYPKGTFNPKKVTCKRCLKHPNYKKAMDRVKYPLFFLKESNNA